MLDQNDSNLNVPSTIEIIQRWTIRFIKGLKDVYMETTIAVYGPFSQALVSYVATYVLLHEVNSDVFTVVMTSWFSNSNIILTYMGIYNYVT